MKARRRRAAGAGRSACLLCGFLWLVGGCGRSADTQKPPLPVSVAGEWKGFVFGWMGLGPPEADTVTAHFRFDQDRDAVGGTFRVWRSSGVLAEGHVFADSMHLTFYGREPGQIVYLVGQVSATVMRGVWRQVDLQDMQTYRRGPWTVRRL